MSAINCLSYLNKQAALQHAAALVTLLPNRVWGARAGTGLGRAISVGNLSIPRGWMANTPPPVDTEWPTTVNAGTRYLFAHPKRTSSRRQRSP